MAIMDKRTAKNYSLILKNIFDYLPSRILIILNSIIIIPIFAHILDTKQMSIFLVATQILNIVLTCTFDWITKAVLRFHEKYRLKGILDELISTIFWISIVAYILIFLSYFLLKDLVLAKFAINNLTFLLTIFLVIPCSIRQFLYQILRIRNQAKLYTLSILLYQLGFIALFLTIYNILPNAAAILVAMNITIFAIDIYIIRSIKFNYNLKMSIDKSIATEILKYAFPLIFTNSCYWYIIHIAKFLFQNEHDYLNTAIVGTAYILTNSVIPILTVFMFASFPIIVKQFELKRQLKSYFTNVIQLFCFIFIPLVSLFCFYSKEITALILPEKYASVAILMPYFALAGFLHELLKLINIKYHLKIKTYIEMFIAGFLAVMAYHLNIGFIGKFSILGAGIALLITEIVLILTNILTGTKNLDYISYKKVFKTVFSVSAIGICYFLALNILDIHYIIKLIFFIILYAITCFAFRKRILS